MSGKGMFLSPFSIYEFRVSTNYSHCPMWQYAFWKSTVSHQKITQILNNVEVKNSIQNMLSMNAIITLQSFCFCGMWFVYLLMDCCGSYLSWKQICLWFVFTSIFDISISSWNCCHPVIQYRVVLLFFISGLWDSDN